MAAGLGFKDFTTGEVLTAADVDGYLMQGVWVFASAAARDAAVTSPQEGNFAYLKDTNTTTYYTGSAWTNLDTTGMVNPMTTTGDTIYSSSGSTPARLGIGSTGQVLTVSGGVPSWATPASGGSLTLLSTTTLSGTTTISSISGSYTHLYVEIYGVNISADGDIYCNPNSSATNQHVGLYSNSAGSAQTNSATNLKLTLSNQTRGGNANNSWALTFYNYASTAHYKPFISVGGHQGGGTNSPESVFSGGFFTSNSAISSLQFSSSQTINSGTVKVYGVN